MNVMNILTLTGPSCSGKTTLLNELVKNHGYRKIISHTTRNPREGEVNGVDYHFVTVSEFWAIQEANKFAETVEFGGFHYGISIEELTKQSDKLPVLICEPTGLINLKIYSDHLPDVKLIKVYIDGGKEDLVCRYLQRVTGEGDLRRTRKQAAEVLRIQHFNKRTYPERRVSTSEYLRNITDSPEVEESVDHEYHAKRIVSLLTELRQWSPSGIDIGNLPWHMIDAGLIPYDLILPEFGPGNQEDAISQVRMLNEAQS